MKQSDVAGPETVGKEGAARTSSLVGIQEVRGEDNQAAMANSIGKGAEDLGLLDREVEDAARVLLVLGVSEKRNTNYLVLNRALQLSEGVSNDSRALAVAKFY